MFSDKVINILIIIFVLFIVLISTFTLFFNSTFFDFYLISALFISLQISPRHPFDHRNLLFTLEFNSFCFRSLMTSWDFEIPGKRKNDKRIRKFQLINGEWHGMWCDMIATSDKKKKNTIFYVCVFFFRLCVFFVFFFKLK